MKKLFFIVILFPISAIAQFRVAEIFSSNMVLQRDQPIIVWGKAVPGTKVEVRVGKNKKTIFVSKDSTWKVALPKQAASLLPQSMFISNVDTVVEFSNILIGDIWVCSGQSNMEWSMQKEMHWQGEKKNTNQPLIRFINPPPAGRYVYGIAYTDSLNRRLTKDSFYLWNGWKTCDSNSVKEMSAVAYYFAKVIIDKENIPIGLINLSIGGAPIETFISREAMQRNKKFAAKVNRNWLTNDNLPEWIRERGNQNIGNNPAGYKDDLGLNHAYKPGFAFECGIVPLLPLPVKGVIWYQGESNSLEKDRVIEYRELMHLLINDYRKKWNNPAMPFYWVQLSSIDTANYQSQYWPLFRDEQRKLLKEVKNGGMAVCSDIGSMDNVHPTDKKTVGERLARWALNKTYKKNIVPSGPLPVQAKFENGKVMISFQYYANGLKTADDKPLRGFTIDGKNEISAELNNSAVVIQANTKPAFIYYGWKPFSYGNLINSENLPASTFKIKITY